MKDRIIEQANYLFGIAALIMLYFASIYNYLLFHTIAEIFSTCIAFTVFLIAWNSLRYIANNYLILVGIASLFIGAIDLFHTMAFKGMQIFKGSDYYAAQLWIAARYFESIILLTAFAFVGSKKKINPHVVFNICTVITTLLLLSIFVWEVFPDCYAPGAGLTPFKIYSEYIIMLILGAAIITLYKNRNAFTGVVYKYLLWSIAFTILSEFSFTKYVDCYGVANLIGHYFKILTFYLIYKTIIVKGIQEPYEIIFREMKQSEQKLFEQNIVLKDQATVDGLTGLYNHRFIYERLEEEAKRCSRNGAAFVVMLLDIDRFKRINDSYGHLTGDEILKDLAKVLKQSTRQSDLVGRYGGEEFLIMLVETDIQAGYEVAEKIRGIIAQHEFVQKVRLTVSIGLEEYAGEKISELINKADSKLYKAKNSGRNKTIV